MRCGWIPDFLGCHSVLGYIGWPDRVLGRIWRGPHEEGKRRRRGSRRSFEERDYIGDCVLARYKKMNNFNDKLGILASFCDSVKSCSVALVVLGLGALFSGCSSNTSATKTAVDEIVVAIESAPLTLDPRLGTDAYSTKISQLIFNGLFQWNDQFQLEPDLVAEYRWVTPVHLKIRLKEGVLFHDGRVLTAEDVVMTYQSVLDKETASPYRSGFEVVSSIEKTGPHSLEIRLKRPFAPFLSHLTLGILPQGRYGESPQGTGPFILSRFDAEEHVVLIRNPHYFHNPAVLKKVIFKVIKDDNLRVLELLHGRIDLVQNGIPPALIDYIRQKKDIVVQESPGITFAYLGFNLEKFPFDKIQVRQAMAHALNIPEIIAYKLNNRATPADSLLAPLHWAHADHLPTYPYDPQLAASLLDQAGFIDPDGPGPAARFSVIYETSTKKDRIGVARLISRYLKAIGIDVTVTPFEWGTFFRDINKGHFQMYSLSWVGVTDPDIYHYIFHSSQIPPLGANRGHYHNQAMDHLTEMARKTIDPQIRKRAYDQIQRILSVEVPYIPLWYEHNIVAYQKGIVDYELHPDASFESLVRVRKVFK